MQLICWQAAAAEPSLNGFDLSNSSIPVDEVVGGGPPRDGIPAIDKPEFVNAQDAARFIEDSDLVIGLRRNGVARAYPLRILLWHEVVNDQLAGEPLIVTYCPLCGTAAVFEALINGEALDFGVSGLLYQSDVLMYDRQTESLWSQLLLQAVTGSKLGQRLTLVPSQVLTWGAWRAKFPDTEVLSPDTDYLRDYSSDPYAGYEQSDSIWFSVPIYREDFANKDFVLGVLVGDQAKAYAVKLLENLSGTGHITDEVAGVRLQVSYDSVTREPTVLNAETGEPYPFIQSFWFAWQAFYPETEVWAPVNLSLDASLQLRLTGEKDKNYAIEISEDLESWLHFMTMAPTNGAALFQLADGEGRLFYRATREP